MKKIAKPQELQAELQRLLAYSGSEKPSREKLATELRDLANRVATGFQGPAGRVLLARWNELHDLESAFQKVSHEYDMASSYRGGDGQHDAEGVLKKIEVCVSSIQKLADSGGAFDDLMKAENAFMEKHGDPADYVREQRDRMFPR